MKAAHAVAAACLLIAGACAPGPTPPLPAPLPGDLALPSAPGSLAPFLDAGPEGTLRASWLEPLPDGGHALRVASHDGVAWSAAITVSSGESLLANWADTPTIADFGGDQLAVSWPVRRPEGQHAYDLAIAFSSDGGLTWGPALRPHSDDTDTEHGFPAFGTSGPAGVSLAWLDGRAYAGDDETGAAMSLRFGRLAPDGRVTEERVLDPRTCDCCPTAAAPTEGGIAVVYRDRSDGGELRDIALVREGAKGWSPPSQVHADGWEIAGCPVNGPAIDASGPQLGVAWFTAADNEPAAWAAFSDDGGRSFGPANRFDDGSPTGRVALALLDESAAVVAWIEADELRLRRLAIGSKGGPSLSLAALPPGRPAGMPRLVRWRDGLAAAWTAPGEPGRVRVESVAVPGH